MLKVENKLSSLVIREIEHTNSGIYIINNENDHILKEDYSSEKYGKYHYVNFNNISFEPYSPFFSLLKEFYPTGEELDDLFQTVNIYPIHRDIFKNYVLTNTADRVEPLSVFDFHYELIQLYTDIYKVLNYLGENDSFTLILKDISVAPLATIEWIHWLIFSKKPFNFKLILTLDNYNYMIKDSQHIFDDIIQQLELKGSVLDFSNNYTPSKKNFNEISLASHEWIAAGNNFYNLFSLRYSMHCYYKYLDIIKSNPSEYDFSKYCEVLIKLGNIFCYIKDYDKATEYFETLQVTSRDANDEYYTIAALQGLALVNILTDNYVLAESLGNQALLLATNLNNDLCLVNSYNIMFWINEKFNPNNTLPNYSYEENFIKLATKFQYNNMLAYFLTHTYNAIFFEKEKDHRLEYINRGYKIAESLDNNNCILSAHLKTALVYSVKGHFDISMKYYEKVEPLLLETNDYFRLAQTYNGIGYYNLVLEDFDTAEHYYNKALENLKTSLNFDEIAMTVLNKGLNAFLASDYTSAEVCYNDVLFILNTLNFKRLQLTTKSRIYGLIGLNNFYLGNIYKTYSFFSKMSNMLTDIPLYIGNSDSDDELFLLYFIQALLAKKEGSISIAKTNFKEAHKYLLKLNGSIKSILPRFILEYIDVLKLDGNLAKANKLMDSALTFCIENNYNYSLSILKNEPVKKYDFSDTLIHNKWIVSATNRYSSIMDLNNKITEINFLNTFQENLFNHNNIDTALETSMSLILNNFLLDEYIVSVFNENSNNFNVYTSMPKGDFSKASSSLSALFTDITEPLFSNGTLNDPYFNIKKSFDDILGVLTTSLIFIPIYKDSLLIGYCICYSSNKDKLFNTAVNITGETLRVIRIAIKQLFETFTRIHGQDKLLELANTDMLTGLDNRQCFYNKLSKIVSSKNSTANRVTLFYIDLDNFKYYNDNFGHKIGDSVLIWFGEILKSIATNNSSVVRFGGDEFLLLLVDCDAITVSTIANTLYDKLNFAGGFLDRISKKLSRYINIPKDKYLSCSIGIVSRNVTDCSNIMDFIDSADNAMYEAKKQGKHRFIIH